jgi:hypothetical protein
MKMIHIMAVILCRDVESGIPGYKIRNPEANVLIGGLLLDCDPAQPPEGQDCLPGKFFEGILQNGEDHFSTMSLHGYASYAGSSSGYSGLYLDEHHPGWEHRRCRTRKDRLSAK